MGGQLRKRKPNLLSAVLCTDSATIGQLRSTVFRHTWWMRGLRGTGAGAGRAREGAGRGGPGKGRGPAGLRSAGDPRALTRTLCSFLAWQSAGPSRWSAWENDGGRAGRPRPPRPRTCSLGTAGRSSRGVVSARSGRAGAAGGRRSFLVPRCGSRAGVLAGRGGRVGPSARGRSGPGGGGAWGSGRRACRGAGGRGRDGGARGSHPELPGPTRASGIRPPRGSRGWCRGSRALAPDCASDSSKRSMDRSVLSSKTFETWVTQCGAWCLLRTYGREGRAVTPGPRGVPPAPSAGSALTSPLGLRRRVTQPRLAWKWTASRPRDEGGCFLVLPGPSPHTWGRHGARMRGAGERRGAGARGARGAP